MQCMIHKIWKKVSLTLLMRIKVKRWTIIHCCIPPIILINSHPKNVIKNYKKCYKKRDKQTDKKRKSIIKEQHYTEQYNDLLLDNLLKQYYSTKVHIL